MSGTLSGTGTTTIGYTGNKVTAMVLVTGFYDTTAIGASGCSVDHYESCT